MRPGLLRTLGAHDEFTLYAVVAFGNGTEDGGESEIWALATVVDGWGRIHCVERLRHTSDPAIRRWILRTGFRNSVMYEYLAYTAATTGGLLAALRGDDIDRELLDAAGEIIAALVTGGPAEELDDWDDGADAIEAYLSVLTTRAETLRDYRGVAAVRDFLAREDEWDKRSARGWTATRRTAFEGVCRELLGLPAWRELATTALASPDRVKSWLGDQVLRDLGVSVRAPLRGSADRPSQGSGSMPGGRRMAMARSGWSSSPATYSRSTTSRPVPAERSGSDPAGPTIRRWTGPCRGCAITRASAETC